MERKMQLNNKSESFKLQFNGEDYVVPAGKFDCSEEVGKFILYTSRKWGKDIKLSENKAKEINTVEESKSESEPKGKTKEETKKKDSKKSTKK